MDIRFVTVTFDTVCGIYIRFSETGTVGTVGVYPTVAGMGTVEKG